MDYRSEILSAYYKNLNGSVIVDGSSVYVGTKIPDTENIFIEYHIANDIDRGTFDEIIREVDVQINCVVKQGKSLGDDSKIDEMTSQVKQFIQKNNIFMQNFDLVMFRDIGSSDLSTENETEFIQVRQTTFKHWIEQKN